VVDDSREVNLQHRDEVATNSRRDRASHHLALRHCYYIFWFPPDLSSHRYTNKKCVENSKKNNQKLVKFRSSFCVLAKMWMTQNKMVSMWTLKWTQNYFNCSATFATALICSFTCRTESLEGYDECIFRFDFFFSYSFYLQHQQTEKFLELRWNKIRFWVEKKNNNYWSKNR
jgi:hypothetical protein